MKPTYEEILQLENITEHLEIVMNNIRVASGELADILSKIDAAKAELYKTNYDLGIAVLQAIDLRDAMAQSEKNLTEKEEKISVREQAVSDKEADLVYQVVRAEKRLEVTQERISKQVEQGNRAMVIIDSAIREHTANLESIKQSIKEHEDKKDDIIRLITGKEDELAGLTHQAEIAKGDHERFIRKSEEELAEISRQLDEERNKIGSPLKYIEEQNEILDGKRNDLAIIEVRLREQFKAQNPDKNLPIELQEK